MFWPIHFENKNFLFFLKKRILLLIFVNFKVVNTVLH